MKKYGSFLSDQTVEGTLHICKWTEIDGIEVQKLQPFVNAAGLTSQSIQP